jgi:hypothetical protein
MEVDMKRDCTVLALLLVASAFGQTPVFDAPAALEANGAPINVGLGGNASPFVVDWDGDNRQDLLLGQYNLGKVRFYRNQGTNFYPVFGDSAFLQADGADISLTYG